MEKVTYLGVWTRRFDLKMLILVFFIMTSKQVRIVYLHFTPLAQFIYIYLILVLLELIFNVF